LGVLFEEDWTDDSQMQISSLTHSQSSTDALALLPIEQYSQVNVSTLRALMINDNASIRGDDKIIDDFIRNICYC
jgi:hypothetical protein